MHFNNVCEHRAVYDSMCADFQRQFDDEEVVDLSFMKVLYYFCTFNFLKFR